MGVEGISQSPNGFGIAGTATSTRAGSDWERPKPACARARVAKNEKHRNAARSRAALSITQNPRRCSKGIIRGVCLPERCTAAKTAHEYRAGYCGAIGLLRKPHQSGKTSNTVSFVVWQASGSRPT
jgi:hypothetical protein